MTLQGLLKTDTYFLKWGTPTRFTCKSKARQRRFKKNTSLYAWQKTGGEPHRTSNVRERKNYIIPWKENLITYEPDIIRTTSL